MIFIHFTAYFDLIFESIPRQVGGKFILSKAVERCNTTFIRGILELLFMAGIAYPVYHSASRGIPLGAQMNQKKFKVLLFDTGIIQRTLNLSLSELLLADKQSLINKGNITEVFVGLELIKYHMAYERPQLYYWHREERGSNAEVDYVIARDGVVLLPPCIW